MTRTRHTKQGTIKAVVKTKSGKPYVPPQTKLQNKSGIKLDPDQPVYTNCPVCERNCLTVALDKHIVKSHPHLNPTTLQINDDWTICTECKNPILKDKIYFHIKSAHSIDSNQRETGQLTRSPNISEKKIKNKQTIKQKKIPKLKLISKRGKRIGLSTKCSNCGKIKNPVWHYSKSTRGPVNLCFECKTVIRNRSFDLKKIDALDMANTGGGFEGNRRRH